MDEVYCTIDHIRLENEDGRLIDSTQAICQECEHITDSFGTTQASITRCLATMRKECPTGERNYYLEG